MGMAIAQAHPGVLVAPEPKKEPRDRYERDDDEDDTWKVA
jgi:hypothetical protein